MSENDKRVTGISKAKSIEEIADFWDSHSVADYFCLVPRSAWNDLLDALRRKNAERSGGVPTWNVGTSLKDLLAFAAHQRLKPSLDKMLVWRKRLFNTSFLHDNERNTINQSPLFVRALLV